MLPSPYVVSLRMAVQSGSSYSPFLLLNLLSWWEFYFPLVIDYRIRLRLRKSFMFYGYTVNVIEIDDLSLIDTGEISFLNRR